MVCLSGMPEQVQPKVYWEQKALLKNAIGGSSLLMTVQAKQEEEHNCWGTSIEDTA